MRFRVEHERDRGRWHLVAELDAQTAQQAVARVCQSVGRYRVRECGMPGPHLHFKVPPWGQPELVDA